MSNEAPAVDEVLDQDENQQVLEEKLINEEYKTWKKNSPFLYDLMLSTALEWPTLTTEWFPDKQSQEGKNYSQHRLLIGTHTSTDAPNYLQIAHVQLPNVVSPGPDPRNYDENKEEIGGYGATVGGVQPSDIKFSIVQRILHPGEINRARYMPQKPDIIATTCIDARVLIWDRTKHPMVPKEKEKENPQIELIGHEKEGFGLNWNPHFEGRLATGSEDQTVRLWDISDYSKSSKILNPSRTFTHHHAIVNDVQHHPLHDCLIGSVSDDETLQILDVRIAASNTSAVTGKGHTDAVNALAFNPASEYIVATASADKTVGLWDLRSLKAKLHSLDCHRGSVTSLAWHPFDEAVLGSAGDDRRVIIWDLNKIGEEQAPDDLEDGPPELMFMHGGHTNRVSDFSWNPNDPWVACSAGEDNLIEVWKVAKTIIGKQNEPVPTDELMS